MRRALLEAAGRSRRPEEHRLRATSVADDIVVWRLNAKSILDLVFHDRDQKILNLCFNPNWKTCFGIRRLNCNNVEATSKPLELQCRPSSSPGWH